MYNYIVMLLVASSNVEISHTNFQTSCPDSSFYFISYLRQNFFICCLGGPIVIKVEYQAFLLVGFGNNMKMDMTNVLES